VSVAHLLMTRTRREYLKGLCKLSGAAVCASLLKPTFVLAERIANRLKDIKGKILRKGDRDYEVWRASMVWTMRKPRRYPQCIVQADCEEDVVAAIAYARSEGLKVTLRSGGHNQPGGALREGGLLVAVSKLKQVEVDVATETAWVQAGLTCAAFLEKTSAMNFAFPAAHTGMLRLGGYLLGGGIGWNTSQWGMASHSIIAADVITADGKRNLANDELLWALRGSGPGFFGAVLRFQLQLHALPAVIERRNYTVPVDKIGELVAVLEEISNAVEREVEIIAAIGRFPRSSRNGNAGDMMCMVSVIVFAESARHAQTLSIPVTESRLEKMSIVASHDGALTFRQLYAGGAFTHRSPWVTAVENIWTDAPGETMVRLREIIERAVSPDSFAYVAWGLNRNVNFAGDSCLSHRADHYAVWYLMGKDDHDTEQNNTLLDESVQVLRPLSKGRYINEINSLRYPHHVEECFTESNWRRLRELAAKYDPSGLFHDYLGFE